MTPHQRTALGCRIAAVALAVSTYWMATEQEWLLSYALLSGSASLALVGGRCQALHFAERARRAATGSAELPGPCCSFWRHSDGAVHGPDCSRPKAARRDDNARTAAALLSTCGQACSEAHTYTGRCTAAPTTEPVDYPGDQAPDLVHPEPSPQASEPDKVTGPCAQHPAAPVIGGICGGCTNYPVSKEV